MTAGAFLTCDPMVKAFGLHEMKNKASVARRIWRDLPQRKQEISIEHAIFFLYLFASTKHLRQLYDRQHAWDETRKLLTIDLKKVEAITISQRDGAVLTGSTEKRPFIVDETTTISKEFIATIRGMILTL